MRHLNVGETQECAVAACGINIPRAYAASAGIPRVRFVPYNSATHIPGRVDCAHCLVTLDQMLASGLAEIRERKGFRAPHNAEVKVGERAFPYSACRHEYVVRMHKVTGAFGSHDEMLPACRWCGETHPNALWRRLYPCRHLRTRQEIVRVPPASISWREFNDAPKASAIDFTVRTRVVCLECGYDVTPRPMTATEVMMREEEEYFRRTYPGEFSPHASGLAFDLPRK